MMQMKFRSTTISVAPRTFFLFIHITIIVIVSKKNAESTEEVRFAPKFDISLDSSRVEGQSAQVSSDQAQNISPPKVTTTLTAPWRLQESQIVANKSQTISFRGRGHLRTISRPLIRSKRQQSLSVGQDKQCLGSHQPTLLGLRCDENCEIHDRKIVVRANSATEIILFGRNLNGNLSIALTPTSGRANDDCTHTDRIRSVQVVNNNVSRAQIIIDIPSPGSNVPLYLCIRDASSPTHSSWFHQGSEPWLVLLVHQDLLPIYAKIIVIFALLMLSGLFSGLNLGLMALDKNELQVIIACGSETEKRYARTIEPVRRRGNQLLCSILFSNTLINSTIAVLLEELSSGFVAIITSTVMIVMVGEIFPQAFCSRHGLAVGAKTVSLTYFCMAVTFPLAYPVAVCLDWALGEEIGHAYDREKLMEFIRVTREYNNLETDEVNIISGALNLRRIHVSEIMTRIEDVFMLETTAVLDFKTIQTITEKGYSRIPVHEVGNKKNIIALLFAKDLALIDPDDKVPVQTMIITYSHPMMFLFEDTKLDQALNEFKTGKSHMAFIKRVIDDGDRDPVYEIIGVVTLEDVIEEIIQMEINDETDTLTDNRRMRRRKDAQVRKDFAQFTNLGQGESIHNLVTPQLALAAYQHLSTNVEPFSQKLISDAILKRLLSQKIYYKVRQDDGESERLLYKAGEPADYFIMILEGRVHVHCGREELLFVTGPFCHFGKSALSPLELQTSRTSGLATSNTSPASLSVAGSGSGGQATVARKESSCRLLGPSSTDRRESFVAINTPHQAGSGEAQLTLKSSNSSGKSSFINQDSSDNSINAASQNNSNLLTVVPVNHPSGNNLLKQSGSRASLHSMEKSIPTFVPDYTVEVVADTCYLKVSRSDYLTALRTTVVERGAEDESNSANYNPSDYLSSIPQLGGSIKDSH